MPLVSQRLRVFVDTLSFFEASCMVNNFSGIRQLINSGINLDIFVQMSNFITLIHNTHIFHRLSRTTFHGI